MIQASSGRTRTGEGEGEGEAFAVDRDRPARELSDPGAQELPGGSERPSPAGRNATEPLEFPLPFAVGGGRPRLPSTKPAAAQSMSRPSERSPIPPPSIPPVLTNAGSDTSPRSGAPPDAAKTPAEAATPSKSEVAKKPLKIDPSLLQRALESRNLNR